MIDTSIGEGTPHDVGRPPSENFSINHAVMLNERINKLEMERKKTDDDVNRSFGILSNRLTIWENHYCGLRAELNSIRDDYRITIGVLNHNARELEAHVTSLRKNLKVVTFQLMLLSVAVAIVVAVNFIH